MDEQEQDLATDGRIRRGDRTRRVVLRRAVDIAFVEGLDGLSIGRLAGDLAISKSGLIGHFGSKEELELATIRAARAIFVRTVVEPAMESSDPGLAPGPRAPGRLAGVLQRPPVPRWLLLRPRLPRVRRAPGAVRDALTVIDEEWLRLLETAIEQAQEAGEIDAGVDAAELAFDLDAYLDSANLRSLLGRSGVYERAARAMRERLEAASTATANP